MADPVSSVAYAIEAAVGALDGDLGSLFPTMACVIGVIALVAAGYHGLIGRFPGGGGGPEGLAAAFGEGWAFLPLGALLVDFTLTIAVSSAAAGSAVIAYLPGLAGWRVPLAAALVLAVAAGTLLGHASRVVFATATLAFVAAAGVVLALGSGEPAAATAPALAGDASLLPVLLALPLGMALATGVEAPSNAIAQLGQLDAAGRRRFGRLTLWIMLAIVGTLTLGLAALAVRLGVSAPQADSTLLADVAERATGGGGAFAAFQGTSAALLLAAAASSFLAGSGLLEALARHGGNGDGLLPRRFQSTNRWYVPPWGVAALAAVAAVLVAATGGHEQELVQFYAVAVFASFLGALVAAAVLSLRDGHRGAAFVAGLGAACVALVLALNLRRLDPIGSLAVSAAVSTYLWRAWVSRGRPGGVAEIAR